MEPRMPSAVARAATAAGASSPSEKVECAWQSTGRHDMKTGLNVERIRIASARTERAARTKAIQSPIVLSGRIGGRLMRSVSLGRTTFDVVTRRGMTKIDVSRYRRDVSPCGGRPGTPGTTTPGGVRGGTRGDMYVVLGAEPGGYVGRGGYDEPGGYVERGGYGEPGGFDGLPPNPEVSG